MATQNDSLETCILRDLFTLFKDYGVPPKSSERDKSSPYWMAVSQRVTELANKYNNCTLAIDMLSDSLRWLEEKQRKIDVEC